MARAATTLRGKLPTEQYLFLLHQAAVTGWIPSFDRNGQVILDEQQTDKNTVAVDTRVKVLTYLVDKTLPAAKVTEVEEEPDHAALAQASPDAIRHTPTHALERAIDAEFTTSPNTVAPSPHSPSPDPAEPDPTADTAFERFRRSFRR